jgi:hypothetical protein
VFYCIYIFASFFFFSHLFFFKKISAAKTTTSQRRCGKARCSHCAGGRFTCPWPSWGCLPRHFQPTHSSTPSTCSGFTPTWYIRVAKERLHRTSHTDIVMLYYHY